MTTFLVIKRMKEDRTYLPGETVVDIPRSQILVQRGYLQIVPDDYAEKAASAADEAQARQSVQSLLDKGYSEGAAKHIASGKPEADWPKYVKAEHEKISAREELREKRTQAELDRLAVILKTTAEEVLDLSDDDYAEVLAENPSPAGNAASDPEEVDKGTAAEELPPFEALMAMDKEGLEHNMSEQSIDTPGIDNWFEDETMHRAVVQEILIKAGYSGEALNPRPEPTTDETTK